MVDCEIDWIRFIFVAPLEMVLLLFRRPWMTNGVNPGFGFLKTH